MMTAMLRGARGPSQFRRRTHPFVVLAVVLTLLSSACGSRLSKDERAQAISALTGGGGTAAAGGGATTGTTGTTTGFTGTAGGGGRTTTTGGTTTTTGGGAGATTTGGGTSAVGTCAKATKAADKGVTADKVTVATLADISGVQPGLFQSAHQAARAAAAYINSTGGICGRQVDPLLEDSKTDSGGNRSAMLDACDKAFAVAGSMSAFDDGSAEPGQSCGIPDMTAITTNTPKYNAKDVFPVFPNAGPVIATTSAKYMAAKYPDAIKHAAILWLNQAVTKNNATTRMKAWGSLGFSFVYQQEVQVLEANYTRFVIAMKNAGVQYVTMVADYENLVRLQKAMQQQQWYPKVRDWDSVAYNQNYLSDPSVEGSLIFVNTAMIEEASSNPEVALYTQWLQRAAPGSVPDYFGLYAWSAYRLFQKLATQIGPDLTRAKLFAALKATTTWNDYGLHAPHQIGAKLMSTCVLYLQVKGGKFTRLYPASGFDCSGSLYHVT